jgi:hypothetical protein
MNIQRLLTYAAVAGGLAWLCKLVVLAATDGEESAGVATFYILGLSLLTIGSIGIALRLLTGRPRWLRVIGALLAPFAFLALFSLLDSTLVPLTDEHVPKWAEVEAGVFTAAVLGLVAGFWALRPGPALRASRA